MEWFTAVFLQFFTKKCQNLAFGWTIGTRHQIQAFQGFSGNFLKALCRSATRALTFW